MFEGFLQLQLTRPLVILDLETTGTDVSTDRIVEYAILWASPNEAPRLIGGRLNPGVPIPAAATAIHGTTDADVETCPSFADVAERLQELLDGCDLCGFNLKRFDLPLLIGEFGRCGMRFLLSDRQIVDVFEIFCQREPRTLAGALAFYCGQEHGNAHTAGGDVLATAAVLDAQLARYRDLPRSVKGLHERFAVVDLLGKFRREGEQIRFNFGRYRGRALSEVARQSPGYLQWMLAADGFLEDVRDLVRDALEQAGFD